MTIFIRISPVVLVVAVVALIAGHMGGISVAFAALGIGVAIAVVLAVGGGLVLLWHRLRAEASPRGGSVPVIRVSPERGELPGAPRAIGAPVRLADDQLEQLAEILRRGQRPEQ